MTTMQVPDANSDQNAALEAADAAAQLNLARPERMLVGQAQVLACMGCLRWWRRAER